MKYLILLALVTIVGCSDDATVEPSADAGVSDSGLDSSDSSSASDGAANACTEPRLFGAPNESTGLSADQCGPSCACSGVTAPEFSQANLAALQAAVFLGETPTFDSDPYLADPVETTPPDATDVCGIHIETDGYRLETFATLTDLEASSASLTHWGACGACSTMSNFAVYAATTDLTGPVRQCGLDNLNDLDGNIACLQGLGFDLPCAQIWAFNTRHTRENCLAECLAGLNDPYNLPDGGLNPCLACDEEISGPVFKRFAGRTRRNSGLASALCRPCSEALPVTHDYIDDL